MYLYCISTFFAFFCLLHIAMSFTGMRSVNEGKFICILLFSCNILGVLMIHAGGSKHVRRRVLVECGVKRKL